MTARHQPAVEAGTAVFFGGVLAEDAAEQRLAFRVGLSLARAGFTIRQGGYNGLMEQAAAGAAHVGGRVSAITLAGKASEWGPLNPHVSAYTAVPDLGARLNAFLSDANLIVGMGGGVGTLHEITAAIWYAGNVRPLPVLLCGETAARLARFLHQEQWLIRTPTRPLDFLSIITGITQFEAELARLTGDSTIRVGS